MTSFLDAGWTHLPGLLNSDEVDTILQDCQILLHATEALLLAGDKPASGTQHLVDLDNRIPFVAQAITRPVLRDAIQHMIGADFGRLQVSYRSPQPGFGAQKLHVDALPKLDNGPDQVVTAIVPLVDFTMLNGSTRIVPGSHRRIDLQRLAGNLDQHREQIQLCGFAGSAFVFSGHLLHSGTQNRSDLERPALQLQWHRKGWTPL